MIIYGWRTKVSKAAALAGACCSSCGKNTINVQTIFRYFHIYWIPVFPYSRKLATSCSECKVYKEGTEIEKDASLSNAIKLASKAHFPVYMFTGLALIGLLTAAIVNDQSKEAAILETKLQAPKVGDFYIVKLNVPLKQDDRTLNYRIYKLSNINQGKVELDLSEWGYNSAANAAVAIKKREDVTKQFDIEGHLSLPQDSFVKASELGGKIEKIVSLTN